MLVPCDYGHCVPWEPNMGCCPDWDSYHSDLHARAVTLAWSAMRYLTGGMVGSCPVLLRPCAPAPCGACSSSFGSTSWQPYIQDGQWYNWPQCAPQGCSCDPLPVIKLPGKVAEVTSVLMDGTPMSEDAYRLDNGNELVRIDGYNWPTCQNMFVNEFSPGSFAVNYIPGVLPDAAGLWAVGVLACEFAKACNGGKCRLPSQVSSLTRDGVSYEFNDGMFANNLTGIHEVDAYVLTVNPHRLKVPPRVWSPDTPQDRFTQPAKGPVVPNVR